VVGLLFMGVMLLLCFRMMGGMMRRGAGGSDAAPQATEIVELRREVEQLREEVRRLRDRA
jgi:cell division protein FtsB